MCTNFAPWQNLHGVDPPPSRKKMLYTLCYVHCTYKHICKSRKLEIKFKISLDLQVYIGVLTCRNDRHVSKT